MRSPCAILFFLFFCGLTISAQKSLQITRERFGNIKVYEVGVNDILEYKLKGDFFLYRKKEIIDLRDTVIFFKDDQVIMFRDLKRIRVRKQQHLFRTFQTVFWEGAVLLFALSATNNALLKNPPVIRENISYISGGLLLTSFIVYELGIRHIYMNKRTTLRVMERDYNNLNGKN